MERIGILEVTCLEEKGSNEIEWLAYELHLILKDQHLDVVPSQGKKIGDGEKEK